MRQKMEPETDRRIARAEKEAAQRATEMGRLYGDEPRLYFPHAALEALQKVGLPSGEVFLGIIRSLEERAKRKAA